MQEIAEATFTSTDAFVNSFGAYKFRNRRSEREAPKRQTTTCVRTLISLLLCFDASGNGFEYIILRTIAEDVEWMRRSECGKRAIVPLPLRR